MANLITEQQKKSISLEYFTRLSAIFLLIISLLGVFLLAYVIPYYILLSRNNLMMDAQFQSAIEIENKENVGPSITGVVSQTMAELKILELYTSGASVPSTDFAKIIANKNPDIQITRLSFNLIAKGQSQIQVNGIAKNRDGLVKFIGDLKSKAAFQTVESPLSDFAKDVNIPFTINIKSNL